MSEPIFAPNKRGFLKLSIDQIKPYDRNLRRSPNPMYAKIKESVRATRGLSSLLSVTRRPGDEQYMVEGDGNTRFKVLKELYNETQDAAFYKLTVFFVPWTNESTVLAKQLIVPEKASFISQAIDYFELRREWGRECGEPISDRRFIVLLEERGLVALSRSQIHRIKYAVEELLDLLPMALDAGLGPSHVDQINRYQTKYQNYWCSKGRYDEEAFLALFRDTLAALDKPAFAVKTIPETVEPQLAKHFGIPLGQVRQELDLMRTRTLASKPLDRPNPKTHGASLFRNASHGEMSNQSGGDQ